MPPTVFLSYSRTDVPLQWMRGLAARIRTTGAEVLLDEEIAGPGARIGRFMRKIFVSDFVVVVCTPDYRRKAENGGGWLEQEAEYIQQRMRDEADAEIVIPVLLGSCEEASVPVFLRMRNWVDLRSDPPQAAEIQRLLNRIGVPPTRPHGEESGQAEPILVIPRAARRHRITRRHVALAAALVAGTAGVSWALNREDPQTDRSVGIATLPEGGTLSPPLAGVADGAIRVYASLVPGLCDEEMAFVAQGERGHPVRAPVACSGGAASFRPQDLQPTAPLRTGTTYCFTLERRDGSVHEFERLVEDPDAVRTPEGFLRFWLRDDGEGGRLPVLGRGPEEDAATPCNLD